MANVHLISGLPASGKTTYSSEIRDRVSGVVLTLDQWLITTHGRYRISDIGEAEHVRRVVACRSLIWSVAEEFLVRGVDVILDDGFFLRNDRVRYRKMAAARSAQTVIHYLDVPMVVLRERIERRNANLPQFNFWIDPQLMESFVGQFEVPDESEGAVVRVVRRT